MNPLPATQDIAHAQARLRLRTELAIRRKLVLEPSWRHPTFADLVLAYGRWYDPSPWPGGAHPGRAGACFAAAHEWADRHEDWTYVEGYALSRDPLVGAVEHAWCLTGKGRVADPAADDGLVLTYLGLPLTDMFRRAQGRGTDSVITFGHNPFLQPNRAILRDGLPQDALAPGFHVAQQINEEQ